MRRMTKDEVLRFLRRGMMTQAEAAEYARVSRQRVHQWVNAAGIDTPRARRRYLRRFSFSLFDRADVPIETNDAA